VQLSLNTVQYAPKALKELTKLDKPAARRIVKAIDALSVGPRPSGARPLVGYPDLWRIRVGDYRVLSVASFDDGGVAVCEDVLS